MKEVNINDIDFVKLKKLDVKSLDNDVYLDKESNKIYKKFKDTSIEILKSKREILELLDKKRKCKKIIVPDTIIIKNGIFVGTIEDYVDGFDLSDINNNSNDIYDKLLVCLDMSKSLEEIHSENIIVSDINSGNIRVTNDYSTYFIDTLDYGVDGKNPTATSKILLNYYKSANIKEKRITKEFDRITMMMLIFQILLNKDFYYITYYEYMNNAEKNKFLKDLVSFYEVIRTNQKNVDMPYLHEIISEEEVKKYKKEIR